MFFDTSFMKTEEIQLILTRTDNADPEKNWLPAYHFDICDLNGNSMGHCVLRIGHNENVYYGGNIGYSVEPEYRGHRYSAKACRLLFQLAKMHGMDYVIISCAPDNDASRAIIESLNGEFVEMAQLPAYNDMRKDRGLTHVRIYKFTL